MVLSGNTESPAQLQRSISLLERPRLRSEHQEVRAKRVDE